MNLPEHTNIQNPTVAPASTYIRETPVYQPYQPYVPRQLPQMPYRPQPLPQAGCGPMVPQYYRPAPYMPRGYVLPYTPTPTYAPPPPPPPPPPPHSYPGFFSVFCSKDDFTYVSRGKTYCQTENNDVVCYAFQHH
ncbi:hypothetical protein ANCCEY_12132 [Ancylostoma ceylanicum]|uniref:Uncharacterized protein n=1 Tax=Ancylostoma ceylanicum TaxID=53326 RepID=A0A0D6LA04_9BILA|nr:hypothetical protein ANCCEY_12132 [Ancylostoma ceylanicum]